VKIRLIQVGLGGWGRSWMRDHVRPNKDVQVVAWVDPDQRARAAWSDELGVPRQLCFGSLRDALAHSPADAVLVTASLAGHVPAALAALAAGQHVLLEKPFAPTLAEARRVCGAAARRRRVLMIAQNYRFYPAPRKVAALVRSGALGAVGSVSIDFRQYANRAPRGKSRHYTMREPLLLDMAIHHMDLMRMVIGRRATFAFAAAHNPPWSKFRDAPAAFATIHFEGGTVVSYRGSWLSAGPATSWAGDWRMECERGEIAWTSRPGDRVTVRSLASKEKDVRLPSLAATDRSGCLAAFVRAIRTGTEPEISGRDNLETLAIVEALLASVRSGRPERVWRRP
jgi:predicted dehydrogenase